MEIKQFLETYPEAKENPLKFAVESGMRHMHFDDGNEVDFVTRSILLQDFVEYVNELVNNINKYEK